MNILVACEFSGVVREAFRAGGHNAWSCDLDPARDNSLYHLMGDVMPYLDGSWDMMIAHPPCIFLTCTRNKWYRPEFAHRFPTQHEDRKKAIEFFMKFVESRIPKICIENPIGIMSTHYRKPDQIIQPWQFGHGEVKATCLWLKGLPKLTPTNIVEGRVPRVYWESSGIKDGMTRAQRRSITFQGIAEAMAEQWG